MWNLLTFPFRLIGMIISFVFSIFSTVVGFIFSLVGSVLGFVFSGLFFVIVIVGIIALVRWFVRGVRGV